MKPSISKQTQAWLEAQSNLPEDKPIRYQHTVDPAHTLIAEHNLRIKALHFHPDLDLMLIVLNNGKTLSRNLSISSRLAAASIDQLQNYELMGKGKGIHWPDLDEDLSLRGFIQEEIQRLSQTLV